MEKELSDLCMTNNLYESKYLDSTIFIPAFHI